MNNGRNGSVIRLLILAISFFFAGLFFLAIQNLTHLAEGWKERIQVRVFLNEGVSDEAVQQLREGWKRWPEIEEVRWVSRDQALEQLVSDRSWQREKDAVLTLVEVLGENPLPHLLTLVPKYDFRTNEGIRKISQRLQSVPEAAEVLYDRQGVLNLDLLSGAVRAVEIWGGAVMGLSLFVLVILVMIDSVPRRDEAGSAEDGAGISAVEGGLIGAGGAALSLLLLFLCFTSLSSKIPIEGVTGLSGIQWSFFSWMTMGIWTAGGGIMGALGGGLASLVRK